MLKSYDHYKQLSSYSIFYYFTHSVLNYGFQFIMKFIIKARAVFHIKSQGQYKYLTQPIIQVKK